MTGAATGRVTGGLTGALTGGATGRVTGGLTGGMTGVLGLVLAYCKVNVAFKDATLLPPLTTVALISLGLLLMTSSAHGLKSPALSPQKEYGAEDSVREAPVAIQPKTTLSTGVIEELGRASMFKFLTVVGKENTLPFTMLPSSKLVSASIKYRPTDSEGVWS